MDNWEDELAKFFESVTVTVEQFFDEVGQVVEEVAQDLQNEVLEEWEWLVEEVIEPLFGVEIEVRIEVRPSDHNPFEDLFADHDFDLNPKITPSADCHPACVNCQHFHGRIYNGTPLICGMHPYGWEGETCPDWEQD